MEYTNALVTKAAAFAAMAHAGVVRRWTGEPYVEHCRRVAEHLAALGFAPEVVAAGFLHDVLEDTHIAGAVLAAEFGPTVAALVAEVTKPKLDKAKINRAGRRAAYRAHLARSSPEGASIKLADMIDNSRNVAEHDPAFARIYLPELAEAAKVLGHGHPELLANVHGNLARNAAMLP